MSKVFKECEFKETYIRVNGANMLVTEPVEKTEFSGITVAAMHGGLGRTLYHPFLMAMAKFGFRTAYCVPDVASFIEQFQIMGRCVERLREMEGVEKIVLMGQSRGAGVMSGYQKIAENGVGIYQGPDRRLPFPDMKLEPADGLMLLDANFGFMVMHLMSMNPAFIEEGNGLKINKTLDPLNPANGFVAGGKSHYSEEFKHKFLMAQRNRYNKLLEKAEERWDLISRGEGIYSDNEPFIIPDCIGINNSPKLFASDMSIFAHTKEEWDLVHNGGTITHQIVPSVRFHQENPAFAGTMRAALQTTVKDFLWMELNVTEDYDYGEDYLNGIDFESCFTCSAGNVKMISCPLLLMGHTAGYEYINAEWAYKNAKSEDKTIAFSEGLTHGWGTPEPEKYGDALYTQCQYVSNWLTEGRFN
ncbi:MAG: hypothetical protein ACI3VB_08995 [Oscillospiraceae bacterium]